MAGLVAYSSSDEDDDAPQEVIVPKPNPKSTNQASGSERPSQGQGPTAALNVSEDIIPQKPLAQPPSAEAAQHNAPIGPSLPPQSESLDSYAYPELEYDDTTPTRPLSPFTATRNLLRDLTLPQVPNLDIPPSPPGSPPPEMTQKVEQFLELKGKKGVHFNKRLAESAAAGNPSLPDRLLSFVGLGDPKAQYETGIPRDLVGWEVSDFPPGVFRTALRDGQEKVRKEKEKQRASGTRTTVEFVPPVNKTEDLGR